MKKRGRVAKLNHLILNAKIILWFISILSLNLNQVMNGVWRKWGTFKYTFLIIILFLFTLKSFSSKKIGYYLNQILNLSLRFHNLFLLYFYKINLLKILVNKELLMPLLQICFSSHLLNKENPFLRTFQWIEIKNHNIH